MTTQIETLLLKLNDARTRMTEAKALIKEAEAELAPARSVFQAVEHEVAQLENHIRDLTLQAWIQTGSAPHPGVGIRKQLELRYLVEEVIDWIVGTTVANPETNLMQFLTVDRKKFDAALKSGEVQCPHVYPQYKPQPTIAQNLSKVLGGGNSDDES